MPQFFGIYYAMGIALILEGFMSSFYHICPTDANFQFGKPVIASYVFAGLFFIAAVFSYLTIISTGGTLQVNIGNDN